MSSSMKKASIAVLVLAVFCAGAWYIDYQRHGRYIQETSDATIQTDQVAISSKLAGYVRSVAVTDNQAVGSGAPLVEIDAIDYRTKLNAAEADIVSAVAGIATVKASEAEASAGVSRARANVQAARATLDFARREAERYRPLVASEAEPASVLSQLIANRDRAAAEFDAQRAALVEAERHVETIKAQATQLSGAADAARVQRTAASNDLASTRLTSPIAGRVASRSVRVGQYVQPGVRLMTIVPGQGIYVVANFKETQVGLMQPGQPATIRVDALPDIEFTGVVTSVTPGTGANFSLIPPQNATGNFTKIVQRVPVRIRIDAGPAALRVLAPGLSLVAEVDTRKGLGDLDAIRAEQKHPVR